MAKILEQFDIGKYTAVVTDTPYPDSWRRKVRVDGTVYNAVPAHGLSKKDLGIEGHGEFIGKKIEFF